ncbi:MAG TPA: hypothetical protein VJ767_11720 [Nitrososphaeraceae archaeon]|nr:hypothetical protein [Nitrososphaeraceae archaeon]
MLTKEEIKRNETIAVNKQKFNEKNTARLNKGNSNFNERTNRITNTINEYQKTKNDSLEKSLDTANKYQQQNIDTIQSISNNYVQLQKNILNTYQSVFSKFIDNIYNNKSYWNKFIYPQGYTDVYSNTNQNITDNAINATRRINDCVFGYTETVNKSMEIAQKYYNDSVQNFFSFVNKVQKSYSH